VQPNGWGGDDSVKAFRLAGAKGEVPESAVVWEQKKNAPKLPSMIYAAPHIYSITEGGIAWCAKLDTGEVLYRERVPGSFAASPFLAEGRIYITADSGETVVVAASPKFEILAQNPLGEQVQASPAVSGGRIYIRTVTSLVCIGNP
jgi:outer membrane protein assembly factor BamB